MVQNSVVITIIPLLLIRFQIKGCEAAIMNIRNGSKKSALLFTDIKNLLFLNVNQDIQQE